MEKNYHLEIFKVAGNLGRELRNSCEFTSGIFGVPDYWYLGIPGNGGLDWYLRQKSRATRSYRSRFWKPRLALLSEGNCFVPKTEQTDSEWSTGQRTVTSSITSRYLERSNYRYPNTVRAQYLETAGDVTWLPKVQWRSIVHLSRTSQPALSAMQPIRAGGALITPHYARCPMTAALIAASVAAAAHSAAGHADASVRRWYRN